MLPSEKKHRPTQPSGFFHSSKKGEYAAEYPQNRTEL
nr:MAG TPA: hypothetical protein [Caudoviricetes sp.]